MRRVAKAASVALLSFAVFVGAESALATGADQSSGGAAPDACATWQLNARKDDPCVRLSSPGTGSPGKTRKWRSGQTFRDCTECPEMVVVPAGSFMMGSPAGEAGRDDDEGPQHRVTISRSFAAGKHEVTYAEWDACVADGGCKSWHPDERGQGGGTLPVVNVSWEDAKAYVAWLIRRTGKAYRLLTEAEWEYAARAGTTTPWSCGASESCLGQVAWYRENSGRRIQMPGRLEANAFGLHDMHGNVWEWVEDCWNASYAGAPADGRARRTGDCTWRVLRGGSYFSAARFVRSSFRIWHFVADRNNDFGFRVGMTLP